MKGARFILSGKRRVDEEEKPFWISFADLMTALMVLFLVAMAVALLAVTKTVSEREQLGKQRDKDIEKIMERLKQAADADAKFKDIIVDQKGCIINYGEQARFPFGKWSLTEEQEQYLRAFVPKILEVAKRDEGKRWIKRIVVEGYTDKTGSYLYNLNLSLSRSQKVICALFAAHGAELLSDGQKKEVRNLFLVGGYSFNAAKSTDEESRRVEMRLEFWRIDDEKQPQPPEANGNFGECAIR